MAKVLIIEFESGSLEGERFPIEEMCAAGPIVQLGSAHNCQIRLRDLTVSAHHAQFLIDNGRVVMRVSAPGKSFTVNGRRTARAQLSAGDRVDVGQATFIVSEGTAGEAPHPEPPPPPAYTPPPPPRRPSHAEPPVTPPPPEAKAKAPAPSRPKPPPPSTAHTPPPPPPPPAPLKGIDGEESETPPAPMFPASPPPPPPPAADDATAAASASPPPTPAAGPPHTPPAAAGAPPDTASTRADADGGAMAPAGPERLFGIIPIPPGKRQQVVVGVALGGPLVLLMLIVLILAAAGVFSGDDPRPPKKPSAKPPGPMSPLANQPPPTSPPRPAPLPGVSKTQPPPARPGSQLAPWEQQALRWAESLEGRTVFSLKRFAPHFTSPTGVTFAKENEISDRLETRPDKQGHVRVHFYCVFPARERPGDLPVRVILFDAKQTPPQPVLSLGFALRPSARFIRGDYRFTHYHGRRYRLSVYRTSPPPPGAPTAKAEPRLQYAPLCRGEYTYLFKSYADKTWEKVALDGGVPKTVRDQVFARWPEIEVVLPKYFAGKRYERLLAWVQRTNFGTDDPKAPIIATHVMLPGEGTLLRRLDGLAWARARNFRLRVLGRFRGALDAHRPDVAFLMPKLREDKALLAVYKRAASKLPSANAFTVKLDVLVSEFDQVHQAEVQRLKDHATATKAAIKKSMEAAYPALGKLPNFYDDQNLQRAYVFVLRLQARGRPADPFQAALPEAAAYVPQLFRLDLLRAARLN